MIDYIKEHKKLIIIIAILLIIFVIIGILIFNDSSDNNYTHNYDEDKTKYKINEVVPIYTDQEQMAKKYLSEYVNYLVFDEEKAFELLDESYKERYFSGDYNAFIQYISAIKTKRFVQAKAVGYDVKNVDGKTYFYVKDADGNEFLFKQTSIRNYSVIID